MSDLMTRSAVDLAAMVRAGEVSARELVQASLDRIEALEPQINAFTHVAAESALAAAQAIGPGTRARSPGSRSPSRTTAPSRGCR